MSGPHPQLDRLAIAKYYGFNKRNRRKISKLTPQLIEQLRLCRSEEARRLILGVSK